MGSTLAVGLALFLSPAMTRFIGWHDVFPNVPYAMSGMCEAKVCEQKVEVATMCAHFAAGAKRMQSGAAWLDVVGPIAGAAHDLCCDDVMGILQAVEHVEPRDRVLVWGALEKPCDGFREFWTAYDRQPKGWIPVQQEPRAPTRVSKPREKEL